MSIDEATGCVLTYSSYSSVRRDVVENEMEGIYYQHTTIPVRMHPKPSELGS